MPPQASHAVNRKALVVTRIAVIALVAAFLALRWSPEPASATVSAGNGIYDVAVEDSGSGIGQYTARTGDNHPVTIATGDNQNVLYAGAELSPGTTFNTIRSYTTSTDYENDDGSPSSSFTVVPLDSYGSVAPLGSAGFRTTYVLPGGETTPDALTIVQDVRVNGTTFADSTVEVTTTVSNNEDGPVDIGIRYLWDFEIACDDGPTFTQISPDGTALTTEQTFSPPTFVAYRMEDNECEGSPTFSVFGTATGPGTISPTPTPPDELQNADWTNGHAFDYTTSGLDVDGDNAAIYYWGRTSGSAMTIQPGASVSVSASVFAAEPGEPPPLFGTPTATPTTTATAPPEEEPRVGVRSFPTTPTPVPPSTSTPSPPPPAPAATATAIGGVAPAILPPSTGSGGYLGEGGSTAPLAPMLVASLGAVATGSAVLALRRRATRSSGGS